MNRPRWVPLVAVAAFVTVWHRTINFAPSERVLVRVAAAGQPRPSSQPPPPVPPPHLSPAASPPSPVASPPSVAPWRLGRPVLVFSGGQEGYRVFRIPALCRAAKALLAFAEARPSVEDSGSIDLVMRRSTDGGRTWSGLKKVVGDTQLSSAAAGVVGGMTLGNPVPLFLPPSSRYPEGRLLLMFCSNAASVNEDAIRADPNPIPNPNPNPNPKSNPNPNPNRNPSPNPHPNPNPNPNVNEDAIRADSTVAAGAGRRVWLVRSDDGGASWSAPREITHQVKRPGWTWYATGPGGGLVLRNGSLVVPSTHAMHGSNEDHSHLLSSHDGG